MRQQAWQRGSCYNATASFKTKIWKMLRKLTASVSWKNSGGGEKNGLILFHGKAPAVVRNSIFFHKGSRRTSASERILAELGTFQGPGLIGPFGLCAVP